MKTMLILVAMVAAAGWTGGCDRDPKPAPPPPPRPTAAKEAWTAEEIAKDPQGYLVWSDGRVATQVAERQQRLEALRTRRAQWQKRRESSDQELADMENLHRRLGEAYQRADDEDRWPLKFADRTLSREKALSALEQLKRLKQEREPDKRMYEDVLAKMDQAMDSLRNDIRQLSRLRQKMEADLEQVRLTQDMAKVQELRKSEDQLASMSKAVVSITDDPTALPAQETRRGVSIDDILK